MTAKEKANELVKKFSPKLPFYTEKDNKQKSKECALICVDEILNAVTTIADKKYEYYKEVKEEIMKL